MKRWITASFDRSTAEEIAKGLSLPPAIARVLAARGFRDVASVASFLNPRLSEVRDPFSLPSMEPAIERVWQAVEQGQRIVVYGDYDADGITATALLVRVLRSLGARVTPFLPHRVDDGYGLAEDTLQRCADALKPELVVTVDCGTSSVDAAAKAKALGFDVVVTDHHEPSGANAPVTALVNPKLGSDENARDLAGVGVAFKLCYALLKHARTRKHAAAASLDLRAYMDLVAVGTIADIVPLTGENRIFARHGLQQLNRNACTGLRALAEVSGIRDELDAYHVGFMLGPRLNAAGRMGDAEIALELLLTEDPGRALELSRTLDAANRERQETEAAIYEEAVAQLDPRFDPKRDFAVVAAGQGWHQGVIGIVASRLCSRYFRPCVVIALDETDVARGSCRSIEGFNIVEHLEKCADLLDGYGGHAMAAGLSIRRDHVEAFKARLNEVAAKALQGTELTPTQRIDAWVSLGELDMAFHGQLEAMKPFGMKNPTPVFAVRRARLVGPPRVMKGKHLKLLLAEGGRQFEAVAFGLADREIPDGPMDVAFQLRKNVFNGVTSLQLNVQDFRPASDQDG
ncbi:MAG: Single-stranded-DNA-specific exonuclease RecJ [Verrucomicrobia bacterium ADurb.Bin345]|nr:MAG: Single-stranded-DNA-specific exonuclease RecJ [Verrucomicrobia bacterium ADurb.Bin345]